MNISLFDEKKNKLKCESTIADFLKNTPMLNNKLETFPNDSGGNEYMQSPFAIFMCAFGNIHTSNVFYVANKMRFFSIRKSTMIMNVLHKRKYEISPSNCIDLTISYIYLLFLNIHWIFPFFAVIPYTHSRDVW